MVVGPEVITCPHPVVRIIEVDHGLVVQARLGRNPAGIASNVVHVTGIAGNILPNRNVGQITQSLDGGSIKVNPHFLSWESIGRDLARVNNGRASRPYDFRVDGCGGWGHVGSHGRFDLGGAQGCEQAGSSRDCTSRIVGGLGPVVVHLSTLQSGHGLGEISPGLNLTDHSRTVPSAVGEILINQAIIYGHRGSVVPVKGIEASDQSCPTLGEGGRIRVENGNNGWLSA